MKTYVTVGIMLILYLLAFSKREIIIKKEPQKVVRMVTAYTLGSEKENDNRPCEGAYGDNLCELKKRGINICASNEFEKGTVLKIGDLKCVVLDRMNRRFQDRVDIAFDKYSDALEFGKKKLLIVILGQAIID